MQNVFILFYTTEETVRLFCFSIQYYSRDFLTETLQSQELEDYLPI